MRLIALAFACLALPAAADPSYWRVTGVAADDTLNVRAGPSAGTQDIGDLFPGTGGIEVGALDASGKWGRIVWQEGDGWVAMRFLAPDAVPKIAGTGLPSGLLCSGTEPFWSLRLAEGSASFSDFGGLNLLMGQTDARVAEGRLTSPVLLTHASNAAGAVTVVGPAACSDGMSDRTYPWRSEVLVETGEGRRFLAGCCQLPLEAGQN